MKSGKTIETAQRALEILKNLMEKELSVDEILNNFGYSQNYEPVYTKEVIYKYLNTFRLIGIELKKENYKYSVQKIFQTLKISDENKMILSFLENYIKSTQQPEMYKKFQRIKDIIKKNNIDLISQIYTINYEKIFKSNEKYKQFTDTIKKLEELCISKQQIKIKYINNDNEIYEQKIVADSIFFKDGYLKLQAYCVNYFEYTTIPIENIKSIEPLPQKNNAEFFIKTAVFKLTDELAINYKLKAGEDIKEKGENYIIINNHFQNYNDLLKRLLRYGEKCEVLYPQNLRKDMQIIIEKTLNLYK